VRPRLALAFLSAGAALVLALASLSLWIPLLIYRPAPLADRHPAHWGLAGARLVELAAADGVRLAGWWHPPAPGADTLLILHGRSGNVSSRAGAMRRLAGDGFGVLMVDWRGYGASAGRPSEAGLEADSRGAYAWLRRQGIVPERLVVVGQSLGNSAAARLAAEQPAKALVLVSPFTRLPEVLAERLPRLPLRRLPWPRNRFEVAAHVERLRVPVILVASSADGMVPMANARRVAAAARAPMWVRADDLRHDGLLAGVVERGALTRALRNLPPRAPGRRSGDREARPAAVSFR
jgi:pimeloyl-ACP methyl ester carboxylesterase